VTPGRPTADRWRLAGHLRDLLDLVFPRACLECSDPITGPAAPLLCGVCWSRIAVLPSPRCPRCGHPTRGWECAWCALLPPYVRAARSVCWEEAETVAQTAVHALKYGGWPAIGCEMGARMARLDFPVDVVEERRALIPVPLAANRLRERGYNQSELLARELARRWEIPVWSDVLVRGRETTTQTRLSAVERARNVSGAFCPTPEGRVMLRGAHVILVDDVVTTASTMNACAAALCDGGARIVSYVTFARAPAIGDRC
jgi:ComF family protein